MADITLAPLPPVEAIRFFESKGYQPGYHWQDVWHEEHARAFTVAKVMEYDLLELIRQHVDEGIREGISYEKFARKLTPLLQKEGWWGRKVMTDPARPGKTETVQLGSPRRLKIIFNTNLRSAHAAGRWARIQQLKARRPYLRYSAILDSHTRPLHREWGTLGGQGIILPVDDPFWETHFPPNGFNCRCDTMQLSDVDLRLKGWRLSTKAEVAAFLKGARVFQNKRTGQKSLVYPGVDVGFNYNVGKAHMRGLAPPPETGPLKVPHIRPDPMPPMPPARPKPASLLLPKGEDDDFYIDRFLEAFGAARGKPVVYTDQLNQPLVIDESFFRRPDGSSKLGSSQRKAALALLAEAIKEPDEIWWSWEKIYLDRERTKFVYRLRRRYLARFMVDGEDAPMIAVMDVASDGWKGVTGFRGANETYLENIRGGVLGYRRPE